MFKFKKTSERVMKLLEKEFKIEPSNVLKDDYNTYIYYPIYCDKYIYSTGKYTVYLSDVKSYLGTIATKFVHKTTLKPTYRISNDRKKRPCLVVII